MIQNIYKKLIYKLVGKKNDSWIENIDNLIEGGRE